MPSARIAYSALQGCIDACDRCVRVMDAISPEIYANALPGRYPVGSHLRHTLEHFQCFLSGVDDGLVDYDSRARDDQLERDPEKFREVLHDVRCRLAGLKLQPAARPLRVRQIASLDAEPSVFESTLERELAFLSGHTIHHLALVVHLCREHGIDLPDDISLAFSTAAHRQAAAR